MECSVGIIDRVIRIILGIVLGIYAYLNMSYIIAAIALIALITGITKRCPLYSILKLNTGCK